jgi:hypothetical protein
MTGHGLGHPAGATATDRHLQGTVPVAFLGLHLRDAVGLDFDQSDGNRNAFFRENTSHTGLAADESNCHFYFLYLNHDFKSEEGKAAPHDSGSNG